MEPPDIGRIAMRAGAAQATRNRREMAAALARRRMQPFRCTLLSTFAGGTTRRAAYRVEMRDGSVLKIRSFLDEDTARENERLRARLSLDGFPPVLFREGRIEGERWAEGVPLGPDACEEPLLSSSASLLAALHREPWAAGAAEQPTLPWLEGATAGLDLLAERGALGIDLCRVLREALRRADPGVARMGIIHGDFCAENMVFDGGQLHVVDNEDMARGPLDYDLGRAWYRWPMPAPAFARFLEAYGRAARRVPSALAFWSIAAGVRGAVSRLRLYPQGVPVAVDRLAALPAAFGGA